MQFDQQAADDWQAGRRQDALARMWDLAVRADADAVILLQALYYMYCADAFGPAQQIARLAVQRFPDDPALLLNGGVIELRMEDHAAARALFERYRARGGPEASSLDGLATACHALGDDETAASWGAMAIEAKSRRADERSPPFALGPARSQGADVIAFSLWGDHPRYLRGALLNAIRAPSLYPGFTCRFLIDSTVPADLVAALEDRGADVRRDDRPQDLLHRLARRFLVADDPGVRRYLVRDADSVINSREAAAVAEWIADGRPFHVMRDWWTHTDPMLAGLWGGIGGALPPVGPMLAAYQTDHMETAHIDQWFLRDCLWPSVRPAAMVHDRCFRTDGSRPFPTPPPPGDEHVGQNEHHDPSAHQTSELARFSRTVPSLGL